MSHSIIPPSSAGIWGKPGGCTQWVLMNQMYPETEQSEAAAEGEASHEIGEKLINDAAQGYNGGKWSDWDGEIATNGVPYTEAMFDGARLYADNVVAVMRDRAIFGGESLGVEKRVEAKRIHEFSYGTCDCFLFDRKSGELFIWDYKFGYEVVEAYENWQAINYAAGVFDMFEVNGLEDQITTVRVRIVQPRAFHSSGPVREWKVKGSDLRNYFNTLKLNAEKALGPDAQARSGSHCKHCPGRHACPVALKAGARLYEVAAKTTPVDLSPEALSVQYTIVQRARKQMEYLESGFEEQIKELMRGGADVPGYATKQGYGRERWARPEAEVIALGDMLGHDLRKGNAITPTQARKLGVDDAVIKEYSIKPSTGLKLVADDGSKAKNIFSGE